MSGLCPFATHRLIPPGDSDPRIKPRVAILHVDAGNAESLYEYFRDRSGGIESHFHVQADGGLEQYRDIYWQADANNLANDFAVSIETQGWGAGEWTDAQLDTIKRLLLWLRDEAGIPIAECPKWDGAGIGYHTQFGAPGAWTPVAKSCPGPDRIKQFWNVLIPWMSDPEGDPMADYAAQLERIENQNDAILKRLAAQGAIRVRLAKLVEQGQATKKELADLQRDLETLTDG
jgi:hypothetical protein